MALRATVHKVTLQLADLDHNHYRDYALTLAQHPSETGERVMVRLLAFALCAAEAGEGEELEFGRGISSEDEPALWVKDLTGNIRLWVEVGLPEAKLLRRACGRAAAVLAVAYGGRAADVWWRGVESDLARLANLRVVNLPGAGGALAGLLQRNMRLQCTLQEGHALLTDGERTAEMDVAELKAPASKDQAAR
jgi:uncharacterized protein YaeQ